MAHPCSDVNQFHGSQNVGGTPHSHIQKMQNSSLPEGEEVSDRPCDKLTKAERSICDALIAANGDFVSSSDLAAVVSSWCTPESVTVLIHRIRSKSTAVNIESRWGLGYRVKVAA